MDEPEAGEEEEEEEDENEAYDFLPSLCLPPAQLGALSDRVRHEMS
jgi:hypothetical protein